MGCREIVAIVAVTILSLVKFEEMAQKKTLDRMLAASQPLLRGLRPFIHIYATKGE